MPTKKIYQDLDHLVLLANGVQKAAEAIGSTYGPFGRTVVVQRPSGHILTKDGMSILKELSFKNPLENQGCQLVKSNVEEVNRSCGDGSTTATLLCAGLIDQVKQAIVTNQAESMRSEIQVARGLIRHALDISSFRGDDEFLFMEAAKLSSNNDVDLATVAVQATLDAGLYGHVNVVTGKKIGFELEEVEGLRLDSGWADERFSQGNSTIDLDDPIVAIFKHGITSAKEIIPCIEEASRYPGRPLLVMAPYIFGEALSVMLTNLERGVYASYGVRTPNHPLLSEEWLDTLAALTGASVVDPARGRKPESFDIEWLGGLHSVSIRRRGSVLRSPIDAEDRIMDRIHQLKKSISKSTSTWMSDKLSIQCGMLSEGMINIKVLKHTDLETREIRGRVEDTLHMVRNCINEGFVPGSGNCFNLMSYLCRDQAPRVSRALEQPFRQLCINRGVEPAPRLEAVYGSYRANNNPWIGWDIGQDYLRDLFSKDPILDSRKCSHDSIMSALSLAELILNSSVVVTRDGAK